MQQVDIKIETITAQLCREPKNEFEFSLSQDTEVDNRILEYLIDFGFQQWMNPEYKLDRHKFDYFVKERLDVSTRHAQEATLPCPMPAESFIQPDQVALEAEKEGERAKEFAHIENESDVTAHVQFGESG